MVRNSIAVQIIHQILVKLAILLVKFYQRLLTPFLGSHHFRFEPTCSNYMITAIKKKGLLKGIYMGILRILKCNPFNKKTGYDPID